MSSVVTVDWCRSVGFESVVFVAKCLVVVVIIEYNEWEIVDGEVDM